MAYVLAGGTLGVAAAVLGWGSFGLHWLAALGIWAAGGPAGALLALLAPRRAPPPDDGGHGGDDGRAPGAPGAARA